jgi:hypothetical protein
LQLSTTRAIPWSFGSDPTKTKHIVNLNLGPLKNVFKSKQSEDLCWILLLGIHKFVLC